MQNIILLFARFGSHITFSVFIVISFVLIINYNKSQRAIYLNSSNLYTQKIDGHVSKWSSYLSLATVNDSLENENSRLIESFINLKSFPKQKIDTLDQFNLIPANVVRSTFHLRNNHITLDKGSKHGIKKDMGVMSERGLLGIVRNVSENFSHVVSLLNSQTRISCTVKPYAYPGNLVWSDLNPKYMTLESIPKYVDLSIGDTVVTNGFSTIFPKDIALGVISDIKENKGTGNYELQVELFHDIPNSKYGYVIENRRKEEQLQVEHLSDE